MSRIAVLPSAVADQIAAGEVVERPASVVKELVENALDAGATSVEVTVLEGGRALVRVADDGCGMDEVDARLAVARHATSKIRDAADLVGVASFGFRGEALPAIGSVSRLEVETAPEDGAGTRVRVEGGAVTDVVPAARRRGTTVTVEALFHNAPARQRFLKGARSEWRAILEVLTTMALVRRDIRLTATHDGKPVLVLPAAAALRARVGALHGAAWADALVAVDDVSGPIRVAGLVERPADVGTASRRVHLSVNGRAIRDPGLVRAAEAAYRSTIPAGLRPTLFLEVTLPADEVDVNVHPAKAEVRFRDRWHVERAVERAVRRALGTEEAEASLGPRNWWTVAPAAPPELGQPVPVGADVAFLRDLARPPAALGDSPLFAPAATSDLAGAGGSPDPGVAAAAAVGDAAAPPPTGVVVPPLVQWRRTYLAFEREDGLVLIDQHSAHERVLYERFLGQLERGDAPAQHLLLPMTLDLSPAEFEAFEANADLFGRLGYAAEPFGGTAVVVHAVPSPHPRFDAGRCFRDTLTALTGDRLASAHARHERLAATIACKAAVKAGDALAPEEMRALFVALTGTQLGAHDVHGRSTVVTLGWDELERRFGRR